MLQCDFGSTSCLLDSQNMKHITTTDLKPHRLKSIANKRR